MEQAKKSFPPDMDYVIALDTTQAVREGMKEIVKTLYEALILVILVVFIFLQGWRATLIPALAVPVSLVGTFAFFPLLGFSLNTIALMGLVLAIGIVVDDAIVVVEAVEHHIEQGMTPKEATLKAMEEVTGPVVATPCLGRGLHSHHLHSRHHRQALSAVCHHHRRLRHHFLLQRPDADPSPVGPAPQAEKGIPGPAEPLLPLVQ